jgi:hypothetical protein
MVRRRPGPPKQSEQPALTAKITEEPALTAKIN